MLDSSRVMPHDLYWNNDNDNNNNNNNNNNNSNNNDNINKQEKGLLSNQVIKLRYNLIIIFQKKIDFVSITQVNIMAHKY